MQPVEATSGLRIEHWNGGVVVAEDPRPGHPYPASPPVVSGHRERAGTRVGERGDLDRLLVERRGLVEAAAAAYWGD